MGSDNKGNGTTVKRTATAPSLTSRKGAVTSASSSLRNASMLNGNAFKRPLRGDYRISNSTLGGTSTSSWSAVAIAGFCHRVLVRHHVFVTICVFIFPITLLSLHWNLIMEAEKVSEQQSQTAEELLNANSTSTGTLQLTRPFVPFDNPHRQRRDKRKSKSSRIASTVKRLFQSQTSEYPMVSLPSDDHVKHMATSSSSSLASTPILPQSIYRPTVSQPLPILYIGVDATTKGEHIQDDKKDDPFDPYLDALQHSRYFDVVATFVYTKSSSRTAWFHDDDNAQNRFRSSTSSLVIVDWAALDRDCHILHRILAQVWQQYPWLHEYQSSDRSSGRSASSVSWVWLDDSSSLLIDTCGLANIERRSLNVVKRSVVEGRHWNYTKHWVERGRTAMINNPASYNSSSSSSISNAQSNKGRATDKETFALWHWNSGYISHDFIRQLREAYANLEKGNDRYIDVAHYWKSTTSRSDARQHHFFYNRLRRAVSTQLRQTRATVLAERSAAASVSATQDSEEQADKSPWVDRVGIVSVVEKEKSKDSKKKKEQVPVEEESVDAMVSHVAMLVSSKIVVVAQADEWEDHDNRLMEALASGALVLCDTMTAPPPRLKHRENIVFYDSREQLDQYIRYYLHPASRAERDLIGRRGAEFAFAGHRPWQVLEALIFGQVMTLPDKRDVVTRRKRRLLLNWLLPS